MINIQPEYLNLDRLLYRRLFRIPEYQRAYSWTTHQRADLFEDICRAHAKGEDSSHFMAAVVCLVRNSQRLGSDMYHVLEVVDGQQRLTTLVILLNAIRFHLDGREHVEGKLSSELGDLLVKSSDDLLLLQTNHDTSHHFANYLRNGHSSEPASAKTVADQELLLAIKECSTFVAEWVGNGGDILDLASFLKNNLFFLLHQIDNEKSVYTVFEVLNSRGLEVSWLDRLKSILMGAAFELEDADQQALIKDLHVIWREIYQVIGLRQGLSTESLRFAATLSLDSAPSRPLGEEASVDELRKRATSAQEIRKIAHWILDVTKAADRVIASQRVNAVTRIVQARLLAVALSLRSDFNANQRAALMKHWENVSFRIYGMMRRDARTSVGDYIRLAWQVVNHKLSAATIHERLSSIGYAYSIDKAVAELVQADCYEGWESELRYFMSRYEEHLAKQQGSQIPVEEWEKIWLRSPSESIEHILPQSSNHKLIHRLGNLVLLTPRLNSKLQDKRPNAKASQYRNTGLVIAREVADRIDAGGWNSRAIDDRTAELVAWARTEWDDPEG